MNKLSVIIMRDLFHDFTPKGMVEALVSQSLANENFEVIIPLTNESDIYETIAKDLEKSKIKSRPIYTDFSSRSKMANLAIKEAEGSIILFLAEDFVPEEHLLLSHYEAHTIDTSCDIVVYGPASFPKYITEKSDFAKWLDESGHLLGVNFTKDIPTNSFYFYFGNSSIKKSLIDELGPINEELPYPCFDDYEYGVRMKKMGVQSKYEPLARAVHDHALDEKERAMAMYQAGYSSGILNNTFMDGARHLANQLVKFVLFFLKRLTGKKENVWTHRLHTSYIKGIINFYFLKYFKKAD
ncbi:glycosyltransferase family 2 protein [Ekhidna sp. To15]|uniref:glycosyltransferase family 2 protein n=1 Tax=Ekhidna sp. To15 TaxID=3395267 RepID=UPI003F528366